MNFKGSSSLTSARPGTAKDGIPSNSTRIEPYGLLLE